MSESDLSVTRLHNGAWEVAAMVDESRKVRVYYFSTREDAIEDFLEEFGQG